MKHIISIFILVLTMVTVSSVRAEETPSISNLNQAAVVLINKAIEGIDTSVHFLSNELPDFIFQLLLWYWIYNFIMMIFGGGIGLYLIIRSFKYSKDFKQKWDGYKYPPWEVLSVLQTVSGIIILMICLNLVWLQILIAPKVWLVEYGAQLIGK